MLSTYPIIPASVYLHIAGSRAVSFEDWARMVEYKQDILTLGVIDVMLLSAGPRGAGNWLGGT